MPRSGTSLTRGLFAAHPAFAIPRHEMGWWVGLYPLFQRWPVAWPAFLTALGADPATGKLGLDPEAVRRCLDAVTPGRHVDAFAAILAAYADAQGRPRWGEKTPFAEVYADAVLQALPDVRVVHVIRDPRDVFVSYRHAWWRTHQGGGWARFRQAVQGHIAWTLGNWRTSVRIARANAARYPDRYRVLRYEDLVGDPARELQALCAFVGEPYDAGMLALDAYPDVVERQGNSSFGPLDGVSMAPVGRYRSQLPPRAIALCEALAGADLEQCGYARSGVTLGRREAWRLGLFDRPASGLIALAHDAAFKMDGVPR